MSLPPSPLCRVSALLAVFTLVAACGPGSEPRGELTSAQQEIIGGTSASDAQVFMLFIRDAAGEDFTCTATLIDQRTLLTAAHCIDENGLTIHASNASNAGAAAESTRRRVLEYRWHPKWSRADPDLEYDVAVALLRDSPGITPKPWSDSGGAALLGKNVRAVGYGDTHPTSGGSGNKLQVNLVIDEVTTQNLYMGDSTSKGFCYGDSGGPTFHTFSDGIERVVGVHSFVWDDTCTYGGDARTDHPEHASFIRTWLAEKEGSCAADGRCKTGCGSPDPDCPCVDDGFCNPDCGMDPNCVPVGQACTELDQCASRMCIAGGSGPYCSQACDDATACPEGLQCDGERCVVDAAPPVVRLSMARTSGPAAAGCAAGGAGLSFFSLLLLAGLRNRRPRR